jgi:hypothetical protein
MPNGLTSGLKKVEEEVVSGARWLGKEAKEVEKEVVSGARVLAHEAKQAEEKAVSFGKSEYGKLKTAEHGLAEKAKAKLGEMREQSKLAGEYERGYVREPRHVDEAKLTALLAPKRPLTDLLGVKKEDGAYAQMVDKPCQLKFKCDGCPYYDKCKSGQKVAKPKTDEQMIDTFFGAGWDDMTKGWERLS